MQHALISVALLSALRPPATSARLSRRACISTTTAASAAVLLPTRALAADGTLPSTLSDVVDATNSLVDGGPAASISLRPLYGLESADVVYPDWFLGPWTATSTQVSVIAPAGVDLFAPGRNGTAAPRRAIGRKVRRQVVRPVLFDLLHGLCAHGRARAGGHIVAAIDLSPQGLACWGPFPTRRECERGPGSTHCGGTTICSSVAPRFHRTS